VDTIEAIRTRRSIRRYTGETVPDDVLTEILKAAMSAPSAGNQQPWHFVVVADRAVREAIARFHPYAQMVPEAPVAIVVCGDLRLESYKGCWVQDCSAATQNMLLAAHAKGLGAVWVGIYPVEERIRGMRGLLGIPDHVVPLSMVSIGHPGEKKAPPSRFRQERVHRDRW
jgi:nitroreductase